MRARARRAILAGAVLLASCDGGAMRGTAVEPARVLPTFQFTRADGSRIRVGERSDGPTVVFFGYTHCPDVCPTTLADWKRVKSKLGAAAARVRFVFVSIDPERDTPGMAARYAAKFDPSFIGVSGDAATTAAIQASFMVGAAHHAMPDSSGYRVNHASHSFLVDEHGRLVAIYSYGSPWNALAADLERAL